MPQPPKDKAKEYEDLATLYKTALAESTDDTERDEMRQLYDKAVRKTFESTQVPAAPARPAEKALAFGRQVAETAEDVMYAGLSNIPGAATVVGALTPGVSTKEGAQQFREGVRRAAERSPVLAGPLSPPAVASAVMPYMLPFGQATLPARTLYSGAVGGLRGAEQGLVNDDDAAGIAKRAALGSALEAGAGVLIGEPLGAIARSFGTPTRIAQANTQRAATREAEAPLYAAWESQAPLPLTPLVQEALGDPNIVRGIRIVQKDPALRQLPPTHPAVLDRLYKLVGSKAFGDKYTVGREAMKNVRGLLLSAMDEASASIPYSEVLKVASGGRQVERAIERGAEATRFAAGGGAGTFAEAKKLGKETLTAALKTATDAEKKAIAEGAYGYLREANKVAGISLPKGGRLPIPFIPSKAAYQAPKIAEMAGDRIPLMQRSVRGGVAATPSAIQSVLNKFFGSDEY
jgi:hypothetical protein